MDNQGKKEVVVIPAQEVEMKSGKSGKKVPILVAAYARVSSKKKEQIDSYEVQVRHYEQKIKNNPDWIYAGIFADEGISGTSLKNRTEFKRMITLCRRGKIKLILCKSFSRFARNTVDCLNIVRALRAKGVAVLFEKENINTMDESSEFLITLFSAFAQAESESLSANIKWGKQKRMQEGHVVFQAQKLFGYKKGKDGVPEVIPEQAEIVIQIYKDYLAGMSHPMIVEKLNMLGIPTPLGCMSWSNSAVANILTNEKYVGDALMQKTYRVDCISKEVRRNTGQLPQYLIRNNHEAIVSRELFQKAQEERDYRRNRITNVDLKTGRTKQGKYSAKYALTGKMVCSECGSTYRRVTWTMRGKKVIVWRCIGRLEYGTRYCHNSPSIKEAVLHETMIQAINTLYENMPKLPSGQPIQEADDKVLHDMLEVMESYTFPLAEYHEPLVAQIVKEATVQAKQKLAIVFRDGKEIIGGYQQ